MTDQIYYKIQYPLKKAINNIKKVEEEHPFGREEIDIKKGREEIKEFLDMWEREGEIKIQGLVKKLREI